MNLGLAGTALIRSFEEYRETAYQDEAGVWTCGWGHTAGVGPTTTCTAPLAEDWFQEDTAIAVGVVNLAVKVPLSSHQFDALTSFTFNEGSGHFQSSTLLARLNAGDYAGAAQQFDRWIYAGGHVSQGLVRRRAAEKALFLLP